LVATQGSRHLARRRRQRAPDWRAIWIDARGDVGGIGAVLAAIVAYLSPALKDGTSFGTFDTVLRLTSLGHGLYAGPDYNRTDADVVSQLETWNLFDWRQIHAGHFPLWNPFSLYGLPQFANFQSSVLSLPDLISYAMPARYAWLTVVFLKLLIAGTGTYVFARVIGLGVAASSFAGITYLLSGGFTADLSWPFTDVLAWVGWIAAFAVLTYRWRGRARYVIGLAVASAFSIYGGFPEANAYTALFLAVAGLVIVACLVLRGNRVLVGGLVRIGAGLGSGILLAMPLLLPGVQYAVNAHRQTETIFEAVPGKAILGLVAPGIDGLPIRGSTWLLAGTNFYETVSYVGIVVVVLAIVAIVAIPRHPMVLGLAIGAAALVATSYEIGNFHPLVDLLKSSGLGTVIWRRSRLLIGFPLGILAATGLETLLRSHGKGRAPAAFAVASLVACGAVIWLWVYAASGATARIRSIESQALIWPTALTAACVITAGLVLKAGRVHGAHLGRTLCATATTVLFVGNGMFLVFAGVGLNTWTKGFYPETAAMRTLQAKVGTGLVAVDDGRRNVQALSPVGFYPELNMAYRIDEFAGHDPLLPQSYYEVLAPGEGNGGIGLLIPSVGTVAEAQEFGISWLLLYRGRPVPRGATYVATLAGERLFHVSGSSQFSVQPPSGGEVSSINQPYAGSYSVRVDDAVSVTLVARVTAVPGWHATIDGRPVRLHTYDDVMQSLVVPAGNHDVQLWYDPPQLMYGIWLAAAAAAGLSLFGWRSSRLARRRRPEPVDDGLSLSAELEAVSGQ
jgi:hypothetical protein